MNCCGLQKSGNEQQELSLPINNLKDRVYIPITKAKEVVTSSEFHRV